MAFDYDLFVIGAGSGGVRAARIAAGHGAKVAIAEEFRIGGTCVIRGCVPKKLLVYASRFADDFADAAGFGWTLGELGFDWPTLVARQGKGDLPPLRIYAANLGSAERRDLRQTRAVVEGAAGGRARRRAAAYRAPHPDRDRRRAGAASRTSPGWSTPSPRTRSSICRVFPRRLLVVGGGYIAVEFAALLRSASAPRSTSAMRGANILRGFDEDMRDGLRDAYGARRGRRSISAALPSDRPGRRGQARDVDRRRDAGGRSGAHGHRPRARTRAGSGWRRSAYGSMSSGAVIVDDSSASSVPSIHAVGDVTDHINLTPVAIREGHWLADRLFGGATGWSTTTPSPPPCSPRRRSARWA